MNIVVAIYGYIVYNLFVYRSIFEGIPDNLETFRYFRMNYFNNINNFYTEFYKFIEKDLNIFFERNISKLESAKMKFPHYSIEDIKFRLVRDIFLTKIQYEETIFSIIKEKKFNYKDFYKKLFFQKDDLQTLNNLGHLIGLHSHYHPTLMEKLNY